MSSATDPQERWGRLRLIVTGLIVLVMFYPTIWMVLSSFKTNREIVRAPFGLPKTWQNISPRSGR